MHSFAWNANTYCTCRTEVCMALATVCHLCWHVCVYMHMFVSTRCVIMIRLNTQSSQRIQATQKTIRLRRSWHLHNQPVNFSLWKWFLSISLPGCLCPFVLLFFSQTSMNKVWHVLKHLFYCLLFHLFSFIVYKYILLSHLNVQRKHW